MSKVEVKSKIPPHSTDAERSILGALLLDRDAVISVIEFLKPEHFYEDKHRRIFEVILQLYQEREPVDVVTVSEKLKKYGFYHKERVIAVNKWEAMEEKN